jgi:hypothetical protein
MRVVMFGLTIVAGQAGAHTLPTFPQVRLLRADADTPLATRVTVEVRDPAGTEPVSDARVTVRALHAGLGSALRAEPVPLEAAGTPGTYQGTIRFPAAGRWELTIEVIGRHVGDAHLALDVEGGLAGEAWIARRRPDLPFDAATLRHLALEWGHLAGFALWLLATGVGLIDPTHRRGLVLGATWVAFAIEGGTGLYKMEVGTPFATPLPLFRWDRVPRVFFADDYVATLAVKHALMLTAMAVTAVLTVQAWRGRDLDGGRGPAGRPSAQTASSTGRSGNQGDPYRLYRRNNHGIVRAHPEEDTHEQWSVPEHQDPEGPAGAAGRLSLRHAEALPGRGRPGARRSRSQDVLRGLWP